MEQNQNTPNTTYKANYGSGKTTTSNNQGTPLPQMAGFIERFVASIVDGVFVFIIFMVIYVPIFLLLGVSSLANEGLFTFLAFGTVLDSLTNIFLLVINFLYTGYFLTKNGQTPGKKLLNLKVTKESGELLTWGGVFLREVVGKFVSSIVFYLGYFWYFMSLKRQTWHDSMAQTYVVKTNERGDVLKGSVSEYPKKPLLAFGIPCGCFVIPTILAIILFGAILSVSLFGEGTQQGVSVDEATQQQLEQQFNLDLNDLNTN